MHKRVEDRKPEWLLDTLRAIGPEGRYLNVNDDWDLVQRAREAELDGFVYSVGAWSDDDRWMLTNKGRVWLGLKPLSIWDRIKSMFISTAPR